MLKIDPTKKPAKTEEIIEINTDNYLKNEKKVTEIQRPMNANFPAIFEQHFGNHLPFDRMLIMDTE